MYLGNGSFVELSNRELTAVGDYIYIEYMYRDIGLPALLYVDGFSHETRGNSSTGPFIRTEATLATQTISLACFGVNDVQNMSTHTSRVVILSLLYGITTFCDHPRAINY